MENKNIHDKANKLLSEFLSKKSLSDAIKDVEGELPETCGVDCVFWYGNREILCSTSDMTFTWLIDSYGDRHVAELFDWNEG